MPVLDAESLDSPARNAVEPERPVDAGRGQHAGQSLRRASGHSPDQAADEIGCREPCGRVDLLVEARAGACPGDLVGRFLELEGVGPAGAGFDSAQIKAAGGADGDVACVGPQPVQMLGAVTARAPLGQRAAVHCATCVPGHPPAESIVRGRIFAQTLRAVLPPRGRPAPFAQGADPRPRGLVLRVVAHDPGSDRPQRSCFDRFVGDARGSLECVSAAGRDAAVGVGGPDAPAWPHRPGQGGWSAALAQRAAREP